MSAQERPAAPGMAAAGVEAGEATDRALARSVLWEALALGLGPPAAETLALVADAGSALALADAARVVDGVDGGPLAAAALRLGRPATLDALRADHTRLFGHTARGPVPPYETEYGADALFQPMHEMADLGAFYHAFGLRLSPAARERPDHVACQCEFLAFLGRKEAHALVRGDGELAAATRQAERRFLRDHLGRWGPAFGRALARHDPGGLLGDLGALLATLAEAECSRVGVPAGPPLLRLRSAVLPDVPMGCGPAGGGEGPA